jgi:hypothetical protein
MPLPNEPFISPTRPIVSAVLFGSSAWHQVRKETVLVASVPSVVSCPHRRWLSTSLSRSDPYDGWMSQAEHFVASGPPIGACSTSRLLRSLNFLKVFLLHPAHLVLCARIAAGVGATGSLVMPGGDHHNCVSPSPVFLLHLLLTSRGGISEL